MEKQIKTWWIPLSIVLTLVYFLQVNMYLHPDMMYLLHASKLMLAGGTYTQDFLETNPPLIMYWYMPVVALAKFSGINILILFRLYIVGICLISLSLCYMLIQKIPLDSRLRYVLLYSLLISLLFLPAHEFGQREHIFMLCTYPYIFCMIARLDNQRISPALAFVIGLFAGAGIALKPFFLTLPIILEAYYFYKKVEIYPRTETITILIFLCAYMAYVTRATPEYFNTVLPIVSRLYFIGTALSWPAFFANIYGDYALGGVVFFLAVLYLKMPDRCPNTSMVLFLALVAYTIAFAIPHTAIFYHVVPALGTAYILFAIVFTQIISNTYSSLTQRFSISNVSLALGLFILPLAILSLPIYAITYTYYAVYQSKNDPSKKELFAFFNKNNTKSSYLYFSNSDSPMLFAYYANADYVGRYPAFWWERGLQFATRTAQVEADATYLVNLISQNLTDKKPRYVLIDSLLDNRIVKPTDYLSEFNHYPAFQHAWQQYHYQTTIGRFKIYEHNA